MNLDNIDTSLDSVYQLGDWFEHHPEIAFLRLKGAFDVECDSVVGDLEFYHVDNPSVPVKHKWVKESVSSLETPHTVIKSFANSDELRKFVHSIWSSHEAVVHLELRPIPVVLLERIPGPDFRGLRIEISSPDFTPTNVCQWFLNPTFDIAQMLGVLRLSIIITRATSSSVTVPTVVASDNKSDAAGASDTATQEQDVSLTQTLSAKNAPASEINEIIAELLGANMTETSEFKESTVKIPETPELANAKVRERIRNMVENSVDEVYADASKLSNLEVMQKYHVTPDKKNESNPSSNNLENLDILKVNRNDFQPTKLSSLIPPKIHVSLISSQEKDKPVDDDELDVPIMFN